MIFSDHLRLAKASLKANRGRTGLTILGVVIGVTSICLVLSFSAGAKRTVQKQISSVGENIITIRPGQTKNNDLDSIISTNFAPRLGTSTLTEYDLSTVSKVKDAAFVAPIMLINGSVKNGSVQPSGTTIVATTPDFDKVFDLKIKNGQFLDSELNPNVAILGEGLAVKMFGTDLAIGNQFNLRGQKFTVVGVVGQTKTPLTLTGFDFNNSVFIGLQAGKILTDGLVQIQQINVRINQTNQLDKTVKSIDKQLLKNHEGEHDFRVLRSSDTLDQSNNLFVILTATVTAIASVSLLVGGIGIMNIMLVSVAERTREIGIRKSVGATNRQILWQFLIEAMIMSLVGGVIGLVAAAAIGFVAGTFLPIAPLFTWQIIITALLVSLLVGSLFGIYPALKAARKHPIEALKQVS